MDNNSDNTTCKNCDKSFSTKYTLKKHIETKICENHKPGEFLCLSNRCDFKTLKKFDLHRHLKICKYVEIDEAVNQCNIENQKIIFNKDNEINELKCEIQLLNSKYTREISEIRQEYEQTKIKERDHIHMEHSKEILRIKEECMEKEQERMTSLLEKVMSKPVITQNNTTTTIKGNNNNLQNILASKELYDKQTDPERIKSIDHSIVEKHFWLGQKGIARFCVDQIVKTTDEDGSNKMLLCCTDPSRKRFKYVDGENQVVEDIDARHFINMVSAPIVTVCREVYDGVVKKIEDDMKETTDAFDLNLLENKTNVAQQKFLEINNIGDHSRNSEYKHEMTILLKK